MEPTLSRPEPPRQLQLSSEPGLRSWASTFSA